MAVLKKIAGVVAGISAVAVIGVAVAQGVPPNPFVSNPALGAGQQSSHLTSMGETDHGDSGNTGDDASNFFQNSHCNFS